MSTAVPLMVFGALALAAGLSSLLLPETLHRKLPETVEDAINFGKSDIDTENPRYELSVNKDDDDGDGGDDDEKKPSLDNGPRIFTSPQPDRTGQDSLLDNVHA